MGRVCKYHSKTHNLNMPCWFDLEKMIITIHCLHFQPHVLGMCGSSPVSPGWLALSVATWAVKGQLLKIRKCRSTSSWADFGGISIWPCSDQRTGSCKPALPSLSKAVQFCTPVYVDLRPQCTAVWWRGRHVATSPVQLMQIAYILLLIADPH